MEIKLLNNKIFVIGTAEKGPINVPISGEKATEVFSTFGNKGTLLEAFNLLKLCNENIELYLIKTTGNYAEAYLNINQLGREVLEDAFYIRSKHANSKYNNIKLVLLEDMINVSYSDEEESFSVNYKFDEYKTVQSLVYKINEDTRSLKNEIFCYANCDASILCSDAFFSVNKKEVFLTGGESGLITNKNIYYNCLEKTFRVISGMSIDIVVPLEANYDDTYTDNLEDQIKYYDGTLDYITLKDSNGEYLSFYKQVMDFCISQMSHGFITHGVMSLKRTDNFKIDEDEYIKKLKYFNSINKVKDEKQKYMNLISVCAGDVYAIYGTRVYNSQLAYSAIAASIIGSQNTTNKPIDNSITLYNTFSNESLLKLSQIGFVSMRFSQLKGKVVVSNGVTTSQDTNFKFFCNTRMVQIVSKSIKDSLEGLIGESLTDILNDDKVNKILDKKFKYLADIGYVEGFSFNVIPNPDSGNIFIDIDLKTLDMVEYIKINSSIGGSL